MTKQRYEMLVKLHFTDGSTTEIKYEQFAGASMSNAFALIVNGPSNSSLDSMGSQNGESFVKCPEGAWWLCKSGTNLFGSSMMWKNGEVTLAEAMIRPDHCRFLSECPV